MKAAAVAATASLPKNAVRHPVLRPRGAGIPKSLAGGNRSLTPFVSEKEPDAELGLERKSHLAVLRVVLAVGRLQQQKSRVDRNRLPRRVDARTINVRRSGKDHVVDVEEVEELGRQLHST